MGFFSWICKVCGESLKSPYNLMEETKWKNSAIVLLPEGVRMQGAYDGYGRLDGERIPFEDGEPAVWHVRCSAGQELVYEPSESASDQGFFDEL